MISAGHATIYVSNMETAIQFYTQTLGLKLTNRFGNRWATVRAGTLVIGLHPWSARYPRPGTKGSVQLGLVLSQNESMTQFAERLRKQGIAVDDVIESEDGNYVSFADPDGNPIYVGDRDPCRDLETDVDRVAGSATR